MNEIKTETADGDIPEPEVWPIDINALAKGQDIPQSQCEEIMQAKVGTSRYPFALMALRSWIMDESARASKPLSVSIKSNGLHINMDGEASRYHAKLAKDAERSLFRNFGHLARTVTDANLTDHERMEHRQRVAVWAMKTSALKNARNLPGFREAKNIGSDDHS